MVSEECQTLTSQGLNLQSVLSSHDLESVSHELWVDRERFPSLILIGSSGQELWTAVGNRVEDRADPVDDHSFEVLTEFVGKITQRAA